MGDDKRLPTWAALAIAAGAVLTAYYVAWPVIDRALTGNKLSPRRVK